MIRHQLPAGIAISGKAASGKSALAAALADLLAGQHPGAVVMPIASEVKREVLELYGLTKDDPGGRQKLMEHGEGQREADPFYWIRRLEERVAREVRASGEFIPIIDDVRYLNELEWAIDRGFYVVRIDAPWNQRRKWIQDRGGDVSVVSSFHPSEKELDGEGDRFQSRVFNRLGHTCLHCEALGVLASACSAVRT